MIDVSPELIAFLKTEYDRCQDDTLEDERATAIDRYNGEKYGDEEDGRSQVVARDTAETVDYMVISILRTLVAGDRVVEFVHKNTNAAHVATETVMHLFMDEQDGYRILHDWLKAGLLEKNAVAMTYGEDQPPKRVTVTINAEQKVVAEDLGYKFIEADDPDENGMFDAVYLEDRAPKFCDAAVPNEEFYCSPDARTITEAPLKGRKVRKSISDLVQAGHDADALGDVTDDKGGLLAEARDEERNQWLDDRKGPNRVIWWHEEYVHFDENKDGVAELLYIQRTSDYKIFSIEEMDDPEDHPFEDWCPFPMQHRRIGQSLADKTMDLERINTVLLRQSLDGIYLANAPRTYVHEDSIGETTIEDLLTVRPRSVVRWKGMNKPETQQDRFDASTGFQMLEYLAGVRENRTGITRLNQGLDADTLNKTATGQAMLQAQGQQVEEYLARNFANALARLFTKKARMLRRYGQPLTVPIDGEYVEVDPSEWPEDMIARPRVGLGSGRKEQRMFYRQQIMEAQFGLQQAGSTIVDDQKLFNASKALIADMGLGDATEFFNDPSKDVDPETGQLRQKEAPPDPAMVKVQMEAQARQMDLQMKHEAMTGQLQLKLMEIQGKMELAQQDAEAKMHLAAQKAAIEAQLAQQQQNWEAYLAQQQMQLDMIKSGREAERKDMEAEAKVSKLRKGGSLAK